MIKTVVAVSDLVMLVLSAQERRIPLPPSLGRPLREPCSRPMARSNYHYQSRKCHLDLARRFDTEFEGRSRHDRKELE